MHSDASSSSVRTLSVSFRTRNLPRSRLLFTLTFWGGNKKTLVCIDPEVVRVATLVWGYCADISLLHRGYIHTHTPSIAFRYLPPNSARFGYATEGAFFMSAQLSTDVVSALRKVWVQEDCGSNLVPKHARKHETHPPRVKNIF